MKEPSSGPCISSGLQGVGFEVAGMQDVPGPCGFGFELDA